VNLRRSEKNEKGVAAPIEDSAKKRTQIHIDIDGTTKRSEYGVKGGMGPPSSSYAAWRLAAFTYNHRMLNTSLIADIVSSIKTRWLQQVLIIIELGMQVSFIMNS